MNNNKGAGENPVCRIRRMTCFKASQNLAENRPAPTLHKQRDFLIGKKKERELIQREFYLGILTKNSGQFHSKCAIGYTKCANCSEHNPAS